MLRKKTFAQGRRRQAEIRDENYYKFSSLVGTHVQRRGVEIIRHEFDYRFRQGDDFLIRGDRRQFMGLLSDA